MNYIQIVCVFLVLMLVMKIYYLWKTAPKKNFISSKPTNILITGGVQGIGKLLAAKFATMHPNGEVNLIVIDIAENLAADMKRDINSKFKQPNMNRIHFYKANLADAASINLLWQQIVRDHGPIHLLVNNAARALGRKVDELTLEQVKLTMDINFHSYVQLMMLFLKQKEI